MLTATESQKLPTYSKVWNATLGGSEVDAANADHTALGVETRYVKVTSGDTSVDLYVRFGTKGDYHLLNADNNGIIEWPMNVMHIYAYAASAISYKIEAAC